MELTFPLCTKGDGGDMGDESKQAEWLLQADFCRKMVERSTDPERRSRWLMLAQQWLKLGEPPLEPQTDTERFEAELQDKGTGQESSSSSN